MHVETRPYDDDPVKRGFTYIRIDAHDVWSMDRSLAQIIVPMLKMLQRSKHGIPSSLVPAPYDHGDQIVFDFMDEDMTLLNQSHDMGQERWNAIMEKMIWTFDQIQNGDWHAGGHISPKDPNFRVLYQAYMDRVQEGLNLFAEHYGSLWD